MPEVRHPEIHLAGVQSFDITDPREYGFDAAVEFPPFVNEVIVDPRTFPGLDEAFQGKLVDYVSVARLAVAQRASPFIRYRGVMPSWDNTARRLRRSLVFVDSLPGAYQTWLEQIVVRRWPGPRSRNHWCSLTPGMSGRKARTSSPTGKKAARALKLPAEAYAREWRHICGAVAWEPPKKP